MTDKDINSEELVAQIAALRQELKAAEDKIIERASAKQSNEFDGPDAAPMTAADSTALLEAIPAGILVLSHEGLIKSANKRMFRMTGHSPLDLIGQHINVLFGGPDAKSRMAEDIVAASLPEGQQCNMVKSDGQEFPVALSSNRQNKQKRIVVCVLDLSLKFGPM